MNYNIVLELYIKTIKINFLSYELKTKTKIVEQNQTFYGQEN